MRVRDGIETANSVVGDLGSNTWDVKMPIVVDGMPPETMIEYSIFIGGVTFDDGSLKQALVFPADFNVEGEHDLHFYKVGQSGSNCHRKKIYQGAVQIANAQ